MRVKFVLLSLILTVIFCGAEEHRSGEAFFEYDKVLHFTAGYLISDAVYTVQKTNNIFFPLLLPAAAGAGKELSDSYFDWKDFGCTGLGAVTRTFFSFSGTEALSLGSFTLEYDKVIDFATGYLTAELIFMRQKSGDILLPLLLPAALGAGKELLEGNFDWKSVGYTLLGAVTRAVLRVSLKF